MSRKGVGTCRLTTRIISSGVMPLAASDGDEGARAGADVDVELVDGPVDRQQVERPQRADLVDAAGEAAAAEDERGLGAPAARRLPFARGGAPLLARLQVDDLAHAVTDSTAGATLRYIWCSTVPPHAFPRTCSRHRRWSPRSPSCRRGAASAISTAHAAGQARRARCATPAVLGRLRARPRQPAARCSRPSPTRRAPPASVEKLYTTAAALHALRARRHAVHLGRRRAASSTPTASGAATSTCAAAATRRSAATTCSAWRARSAQAGILRVDGSVLGDESRFDACAAPSTPAAPTTATSAACSAR